MRTALALLLLAANAAAAPKGRKAAAKPEALEAVAACVRTAGDVARSTAAAASAPEAPGDGDCPKARRTLMSALQKAPHDRELAGATLDLHAAGWFELSEKAKRRLRVTAGRKD